MPILPVWKPTGWGWWFVQDLRATNKLVISCFSVVPNSNSLLLQVLPDSKWFTFVDLCAAVFSIPADSSWQYIDLHLWTIVTQRFTEALSISQVLHQDLSALNFPGKLTLLQFAGNLLLCSATKEASIKDSIYLPQLWGEKGHKGSKEKLQLPLDTVHYLGHNLNAEGIHLSPKRIKLIQESPRPITKQKLHRFLGLAGYCRLQN